MKRKFARTTKNVATNVRRSNSAMGRNIRIRRRRRRKEEGNKLRKRCKKRNKKRKKVKRAGVEEQHEKRASVGNFISWKVPTH